ncbi:MAG: hypothetical protein HXX19_00150 [Rhodoferax sp.]|nr:hypothetical protein [Rhodoferax sp.]
MQTFLPTCLSPNMSVEISEKRANARSQFFLLQSGGEPHSFYAFRPEDAADAVPALVVDLSGGGLQILTANAKGLAQQSYQLELVTNGRVGSGKHYRVHAVWSRPDGVNVRTGFASDEGSELVKEVEVLLAGSDDKVLRCVLYPN